jgi:hypothetical protein
MVITEIERITRKGVVTCVINQTYVIDGTCNDGVVSRSLTGAGSQSSRGLFTCAREVKMEYGDYVKLFVFNNDLYWIDDAFDDVCAAINSRVGQVSEWVESLNEKTEVWHAK